MSSLTNLLFGKLPQYTRKARHLRQLMRHRNLRKTVNLLQVEWALRRGHTRVRGMPYIYIIDPCNVCNLRCPLCPTGQRTPGRPTKMMNFECYQAIIDEVKRYAVEVILHNWGESFLHPRIFDMIRYAQEANICTNISSHFNKITEEKIEQIIDSGLENLSVSLDGATQAVYETYRVNGRLADAISALKLLQERKRQRGSKTPLVEWQFIVMKHNEHELPRAEALARELGLERFRPIAVGLPFDHLTDRALADRWIANNDQFKGYHPESILRQGFLYDETCFYPYRSMTINPDGGIAPCCAISHEKWDFGSFPKDRLTEIYNNRHYRSARSLFSNRPIEDPVATVCDRCPLYHQKNPKQGSPIRSSSRP